MFDVDLYVFEAKDSIFHIKNWLRINIEQVPLCTRGRSYRSVVPLENKKLVGKHTSIVFNMPLIPVIYLFSDMIM